MDYYEFPKRYVSILLVDIILIPVFIIISYLGWNKSLPMYINVILWGVITIAFGFLLYPILKKRKLI
jgi:hypothetical protein